MTILVLLVTTMLSGGLLPSHPVISRRSHECIYGNWVPVYRAGPARYLVNDWEHWRQVGTSRFSDEMATGFPVFSMSPTLTVPTAADLKREREREREREPRSEVCEDGIWFETPTSKEDRARAKRYLGWMVYVHLVYESWRAEYGWGGHPDYRPGTN